MIFPVHIGVMQTAGGVSLSQTASAGTDNASNSATFASQSIGAAASDRQIFVCVHVRQQDVSSVTVGGVSASLVVSAAATALISGETSFTAEIWRAAVPTGTTADVVVTTTGSTSQWLGIVVYRATGINTTVVDTGAVNGTTTPSDTLTAVSGGFCIAAATGNGTGPDCTWSNVTEDVDANSTISDDVYSSASAFPTSTSITPSLTFSTTGSTFACMCCATYQAA